MGYEGDMHDYLEDIDPGYSARQAEALAQRKKARENRFPPDPLPEGQKGVILLNGYSRVDVATNSGWRTEGGWQDK